MNQFFTKVSVVFLCELFVFAGIISSANAGEIDSIKQSFEKLVEGNQRYINSSTVCHEDWTAKRMALAHGQTPFAVIVACSDSRVPPEIIFDQTLGALFVVRVAGNVVDDFAIGSIEYGVSVLKANLIIVLGHSNCGAVDAAMKGLRFENHIQSVLDAIEPAVKETRGKSGDLLEKTIKANVKNVEQRLKNSKPVLAELIDKGSVRILGAYYDLGTGKVEFLDRP